MKPVVALTLIVCGTLVAAMPIVAHRLGLQLTDVGSLLYFALATVMTFSAIFGSVVNFTPRVTRGFEVLPAVPAA